MTYNSLSEFFEGIEAEIRVEADGRGFLSIRGTARICGVDESALRRHFSSADFSVSKLSETLTQYKFEGEDFSGSGVPDTALAIIVQYYASMAGRRCTAAAKQAAMFFSAVGARQWMQQAKGWVPPSEPEEVAETAEELMERLESRQELRTDKRLELMRQCVIYARRHKLSAPKVCADAHDALNILIQGHPAEELRKMAGLVDNTKLLRDHFPKEFIGFYSDFCNMAATAMRNKGISPIDAINRVTALVLPEDYNPAPCKMLPNVYDAINALPEPPKRKRRRKLKGNQLGLF